jgi:hypothetical protein
MRGNYILIVFDDRVLVIDETRPPQARPITGKADRLEDPIGFLNGVRNGRNEPSAVVEFLGLPPLGVGERRAREILPLAVVV